MTETNKRENIGEELSRAAEALAAADILYEKGLISDAVSRLYYFVLYNIRALLLSKGYEARSHEGALRLFGLHFVKTRVFSPASSHVFSKLMKYRGEADYNPSYVFTKEDFRTCRAEAYKLADAIKKYLRKMNYMEKK